MSTHPTLDGPTQCELILAELQRRYGEWVPLIDLAGASRSMAVHSRISDLRGRGHEIAHHNQRRGRTVRSFYRLSSNEQQPNLI